MSPLKLIEGLFRKRAEATTAQFRDHVRQVRTRSLPLRIDLISSSDTAWLDGLAARPVVEFLSQLGFQPAGVVTVKGNDNAVVAGYAAPHYAVYASISKGTDAVFLSFVSHFTDGSAFECIYLPK
jgi:hypothetical protein